MYILIVEGLRAASASSGHQPRGRLSPPDACARIHRDADACRGAPAPRRTSPIRGAASGFRDAAARLNAARACACPGSQLLSPTPRRLRPPRRRRALRPCAADDPATVPGRPIRPRLARSVLTAPSASLCLPFYLRSPDLLLVSVVLLRFRHRLGCGARVLFIFVIYQCWT